MGRKNPASGKRPPAPKKIAQAKDASKRSRRVPASSPPVPPNPESKPQDPQTSPAKPPRTLPPPVASIPARDLIAPSTIPAKPAPAGMPSPRPPLGGAPGIVTGLAGMPLVAVASTGPGKASGAGPKSGVVIVGSLNMDLVVRTEVMPLPGQTVMGQDLIQNAGGKGGNQAAAVGQLWQKRSPGAKIVARVGDDLFGQNVVAALQKARVDTASVLTTRQTPSGTAMILVDRHGENAIVVAGGANRLLSATDLLAQRKTIESSVVLLAQLEVPADTIACGFALAKRSGVLTILDPAPAPVEGLAESLYHVDIFMPNQTEAHLLTGILVRTLEDARRAAERFLLRGARIVVMKMGSQGAVIIYKESAGPNSEGAAPLREGATIAQHVPGFRVPVVDTTGAGDAFAGALAVALAEGMPLAQAVRFANAAGALACTKLGAMASMPARADVEKLLANV